MRGWRSRPATTPSESGETPAKIASAPQFSMLSTICSRVAAPKASSITAPVRSITITETSAAPRSRPIRSMAFRASSGLE